MLSFSKKALPPTRGIQTALLGGSRTRHHAASSQLSPNLRSERGAVHDLPKWQSRRREEGGEESAVLSCSASSHKKLCLCFARDKQIGFGFGASGQVPRLFFPVNADVDLEVVNSQAQYVL